jgi:hypothetical protein
LHRKDKQIMLHRSQLWKIVSVVLLLVLTLGQVAPALGQAEDEETSGDVAVGKDTPAAGESSSIDMEHHVFLPLTQSGSAEVDAAAPSAIWRTVFYDEFCSFPNAWARYDYNGTGHVWAFNIFNGLCVAQPNGYVNTMHTLMSRTFSLVGAQDARITFRFQMRSEISYDFLLTQFSCDGGATWYGQPNARSNPPAGWVVRVIKVKGTNCLGKSSVIVRYSFVTDQSVIPFNALPPALDYVLVEKFQ